MAYIVLENLLDKSSNSVYKLVNLAAKRAIEVAEGQPKLVNTSGVNRPSTVALDEISEGKVHVEGKKAKKE